MRLFYFGLLGAVMFSSFVACGSSDATTSASSSVSASSTSGTSSVSSSEAASSGASSSGAGGTGGAGGSGGSGGTGPEVFMRTGGTFKAFPFAGKSGAVQITPGYTTELAIADRKVPDLCDDPVRKSTTVLSFRLANYTTPLHTGTFTQTDLDMDGDFYGGIAAYDAICGGPLVGTAKGSTLTIQSISPNLTGSVDWTFKDGTTFAGTFDVPLCATAPTGLACVP